MLLSEVSKFSEMGAVRYLNRAFVLFVLLA